MTNGRFETMKKIVTVVVCLLSGMAHCQSWQWGKRGGSIDQLSTTGGDRQEEVYAIVTDSQKNIYTLSAVGMNNLNIDGNVKTNFGDSTTLTDVALSSFSCDGTYRWSKIIGGGGYDRVPSLQIDAQDNVYIAGKFAGCQDAAYPPRIDNDVIIPQMPQDCGLIFIAKFNSNGVMQWFKRPQSSSVSPADGISFTASCELSTDALGNCYWLTGLPPGSYANGSLTVTGSGMQYYILKYDANGNFTGSTSLDMQMSVYFNFTRNPYNGYYYFSGRRGSASDTAIIAGQNATHAAFLWCFNDQGQFQWLKESSNANVYNTIFWYNYAFDPQNNIYIGGNITGANYENFLGVSPSQFNNPPFLMKLNPTADTVLWSTYPNRPALQRGAIVLKDNEVGLTSCGITNPYTWGTQSLTVSNISTGFEVVFGRFNKDTGACLGLSRIVGDTGYDDIGTALAVDASGDYILGGGVGHQLTFATNTITNIGSQSDFFVAKYSTSVCSLHTEDFKEEGLELAPNPVVASVRVATGENLRYQLYSISGVVVKEGTLNEQANTIDFSGMAVGTYILRTVNDAGKVKQVKLVKE